MLKKTRGSFFPTQWWEKYMDLKQNRQQRNMENDVTKSSQYPHLELYE